jgi:uncharacterized protein with GYD domain
MMIRAVMLIKSGGRVPRAVKLARELKRMAYVTDAYAVFGRFDIVAFLQSDDVKQLFKAISRATKFAGIMSTETLVEGQGNRDGEGYGRGPFSS